MVTLLLAYYPFGTGNPKCLGSTSGLFLHCVVAEVFLFGTSNPAEPRAVGTGGTMWVNGSDGKQDPPASILEFLGPWIFFLIYVGGTYSHIWAHSIKETSLNQSIFHILEDGW